MASRLRGTFNWSVSAWWRDEGRDWDLRDEGLGGGGGEEEPRILKSERGRLGGGVVCAVEVDSKSERVFWKKLLFSIDGELTGV